MAAFVDVLREAGEWLTAKEIAARMPEGTTDRVVRALASAPCPQVVSFPGSKGYKEWALCTVAEIGRCIAAFESQGSDMLKRAVLHRPAYQRRFGRAGMNVLGQLLDDREARRGDAAAAEEAWLRERGGVDAMELLQSWDRWVLAEALELPAEAARRDRLVAQCAEELTVVARQLRGRGWPTRKRFWRRRRRQRVGKVRDF